MIVYFEGRVMQIFLFIVTFRVIFSISIKLAEQIISVCVASDDNIHYLILIYPPIKNLHITLLEQHTRQLIRLINFLFGSIHRGLFLYKESIEYFFDIFFYRLNYLSYSSTLKNIRIIDEFLPSQFNDYGICPKLLIDNQKLLININGLLNQFECQNINECSNENDFIINRYRRIFFINGSILFHRTNLLISHLSNQLTNDIYRFLLHYGHLNLTQFSSSDLCQILLFKEIFPFGYEIKQRLFLIVCCQGELTLAIIIENQYEKDFNISPDHGLIQQIKLVLNDIYSIFPKNITNSPPWIISSPANFVKKQLKRTISLPLIGGICKNKTLIF